MMIHKCTIIIFLACCFAALMPAADIMEGRMYKAADGQTLPYRLFTPPARDGRAKLPLLVFLHGNGNQGDALDTWQSGHLYRFTTPAVQTDHPCFVLCPRPPAGQKWADTDWGKGSYRLAENPTKGMRLTLEIIAYLQKEFPDLDPSRIYVGGMSMGGYGSWELILRRPDLFAAAFPMCGAGDPSQAASIAKLPIWAFHGEQDGTVPVRGTREMIEALKKAGGEPRYSEYPGVDHNCWDRALNEPELVPWLFAQKRTGVKSGKSLKATKPGH